MPNERHNNTVEADPSQRTVLVIDCNKVLSALSPDNNLTVPTFPLLMYRGDPHTAVAYRDFPDTGDITDIALMLRRRGLHHEVPLPARINRGLRNYIRGEHQLYPGSDASTFVYTLWRLTPPDIGVTNAADWLFIPFSENDLKVGDTVALLNKNTSNQITTVATMMLYIGHGLFIAPAGRDAPLMVADLTGFQTLYPSDTISKMKPANRVPHIL